MAKPKSYYTDKQGRTRPIAGKSGAGVVVVAGALAIGAAGAGPAVLGGSGSAGSGAGGSVRAHEGAKSARTGDHRATWRKLGLRQTTRPLRRHSVSCAVSSYGQVQAFFLASPCRSLQRMRFTVHDQHGGAMVVSVAWVRQPTTATATALKRLVDTDGTGNIAPIGLRRLQAQGIRITGDHFSSRRTRTVLTLAEVEPAGGAPSTDVLDDAALVASRFPRP